MVGSMRGVKYAEFYVDAVGKGGKIFIAEEYWMMTNMVKWWLGLNFLLVLSLVIYGFFAAGWLNNDDDESEDSDNDFERQIPDHERLRIKLRKSFNVAMHMLDIFSDFSYLCTVPVYHKFFFIAILISILPPFISTLVLSCKVYGCG